LTGGGCLTAPPPGRPRLPSAPLPICDIEEEGEREGMRRGEAKVGDV
jgi:hypothetical protein